VDGFNQDQHASKVDNGGVAFGGLRTARRDMFVSFHFAYGLPKCKHRSCTATFERTSSAILEIANMALFPASPLTQRVTGQTIAVDGGQLL
jgi:NAD(P)-dependent dehydrogenase (short-subunit alcohol dehydrogenase family)